MFPMVVFCQNLSDYPYSYYYIFKNIVIDNPAPVVESEKGELNALFQGRRGLFSDVNSMLFSGILKLGKAQFVGMYVSNENESEFLRRTRYYGNYGVRIKLSEKFRLHSGIMVGAASYQFLGSLGGVGGSALGIDGSLGLTVVSEKLAVGLSLHQIPQASLRPMQYYYQLRRFWSIVARYKHPVTEKSHLWGMLDAKVYADREDIVRSALALEASEKVFGGVQADNRGNASVFAGIKFRVGQAGSVSLNFNYIMQNLLYKKGYRLDMYELSTSIEF